MALPCLVPSYGSRRRNYGLVCGGRGTRVCLAQVCRVRLGRLDDGEECHLACSACIIENLDECLWACSTFKILLKQRKAKDFFKKRC